MTVNRNSSRCTLALRLSALLFGLLALSPAQALTVCASSVAVLDSALSLGTIQNQAYTIKIVQGTYLMDADLIYTFSAPTTIEGGYTANCAARVVDAVNTVINIGQNHSFDFRQNSASPQAQINVDGLTLANSNRGLFFKAGAFGTFSNDEGSVTLSRVHFTQMTSDSDVLLVRAYNGSVNLENVLFDHISTSATCVVSIDSIGRAPVTINHMTADFAGGNDLCMTDDHSQTAMFVYNSILWNSDGGNSIFRGGFNADTTVAFFNDIFHGQAIPGTPIFQDPIHTDPRWIDPANGNYRLQTNPLSPGINTGTSLIFGGEPATDIEGHPRIVGSLPDRGAYESAFSDLSVLTVTNRLDSGAGSLRQAILNANSSPSIAKSIKFDIRGAGNVPICPAVIALNSALPSVASTMLIDGYTQPLSTKNTHAAAFNANLCMFLKPAAGTLSTAFRVLSSAGAATSLTLRGFGIGGFGQPVQILGGVGHVITGNQFGGVANGVDLPGAALSAITIGLNAGGSLIVGGLNNADRNVIGGAGFNGIDVQSGVQSSIDRCQIVNNLIGLAADGHTALANNFGINVSGSGCGITRNRIAGNTIHNLWINAGSGNVVQQNQIGITTQGSGFLNSAIGILVTGDGNTIGAGGNGGAITANTIRFMGGGGVVIKGTPAIGNSVNANLIYDNGPSGEGEGMDIDLQPTNVAAGPTANDPGDSDGGPNFQQNFPVAKGLSYTGPGTGPGNLDRPANLTVTLDTQPGVHRVDVYFSSSANAASRRGHAEVFLGHSTVTVSSGPVTFSMPIVVPNQLPGGVISLTTTDALGNTSEVGTGLPIDAIFVDGFDVD